MKQRTVTSVNPTNAPTKTRWLVVFILLNCLALNFLISFAFHQESVLTYTVAFFQRIAQNDSWMPMHKTLQYLHSPELQQYFSHQPIYQVLFFGERVKFQYPPTSLLFVEPFIQIDTHDSNNYATLNTISFVLVLLMLGLLVWFYQRQRKTLPGTLSETKAEKYFHFILPVILGLMFYPLLRAYILGQIQIWLDALFIGAVLAWSYQKKTLAGVLCGIMTVIKPQFGVLLLWGFIRKEKQFSFAFGGTAFVLLLISIINYGFENHVDYLNVLTHISQHGESYYPNQSVNGLLNRMLFNGNNLEWQEFEFAPYHPFVFWGTTISSLLLLGFALLWRKKQTKETSLIDFLIVSLSLTIAAPVSWEHHYGILLPIYLVALIFVFSTTTFSTSSIVLLGCSYFLTSNLFDSANLLADSSWNILQSYLLFGAILLLILLYRIKKSLLLK
jgi:hypothetical protein